MLLRPYLLALVFLTISCVMYFTGYEVFEQKTEFVSIVATFCQVSATMMGFMLAALAILASITDKPLLERMNQQGHYNDLLTHLFIASFIYFAVFVVTGLLLVLPPTTSFIRSFTLVLMVTGCIATIQVGYKFWIVLKNLR